MEKSQSLQDNFVRAISTPTTTTTTTTNEDAKTKKPSRTSTGANKIPAPLKTKENSSTSSSREKLTGSSEKIFAKKNVPTTPLKKEVSASAVKQPVSLPSVNMAENKSSPKKHSFGKSTPPPKPKPPSVASKGNLFHSSFESPFIRNTIICRLETWIFGHYVVFAFLEGFARTQVFNLVLRVLFCKNKHLDKVFQYQKMLFITIFGALDNIWLFFQN